VSRKVTKLEVHIVSSTPSSSPLPPPSLVQGQGAKYKHSIIEFLRNTSPPSHASSHIQKMIFNKGAEAKLSILDFDAAVTALVH
jgi:hypothetical protein